MLATSCLALAVLIAPPLVAATAATTGHQAGACQAAPCDRSAPESSGDVDPTVAPVESQDPAYPPDGDVSIDGPFLTPTPTIAPDGAVLGATATPAVTPPATDVSTRGAATAGVETQLLFLVLAGVCSVTLLVGRPPARIRS